MDPDRIAALHARIGALTEERDALAALVEAFVLECGSRFGDPGNVLVGVLCPKHGLAFRVARENATARKAEDDLDR